MNKSQSSDIIEQTLQAKQLAKELRNIGPKTALQLIKYGIDSKEKLISMGAKKAYLHILNNGGFCGLPHAAYLYALEGAVQDCSWLKIPEQKKNEYKELTREMRESVRT